MDKKDHAQIAVDYLNENGCVPVSFARLKTLKDAAATAQMWLDRMSAHSDCCGTKEMRELLAAIAAANP